MGMSKSVTRVQPARVAVAVAIACIVGWGAGAQAANENLLEGLPDNLKSLYEGATDTLAAFGLRQFQDAAAAVEVVPLRILSRQSVARRADQRTQAPRRRLQGGGQGQRLRAFRLEQRHQPADRADPRLHRQEVLDHHRRRRLVDRSQRRDRGRLQGRNSGCHDFQFGHQPLRHQRRLQLRALGLRHGVGDQEGPGRQGQRADGRGHRRRADRGAGAGRAPKRRSRARASRKCVRSTATGRPTSPRRRCCRRSRPRRKRSTRSGRRAANCASSPRRSPRPIGRNR